MLLAAASTVSSLYVVPGSACAALCLGNSTSTTTKNPTIDTSDIACKDGDFTNDAKGIKFKNCIDCLEKSEESDGDNSDVKWMLYNLRFALDTCLFDPEFVIESPCIIKSGCEPLEKPLSAGLETPGNGQFDYCTADGNSFSSKAHWSCVTCLHASEEQVYMSNFLQALKAGCEQRPDPGKQIIYRGDIFSDELLNITVHNIVLPGEGGAKSNDITTGTIVGIAAGAGLFLIGLAAVIWAYCRRRNKRLAAEANAADQSPPPDRSNASSFTAINHSPFLNVGDHKKSPSVRSTEYQLREKPNNFSSNAEYYERYEEDLRAGRNNAHYNYDPRAPQSGPGSALPTHRAYDPRVMSRGTPSPVPPAHRRTQTAESYAMQAYLNANDASSHHGSARSRSATPSGRGSPPNSRVSAEHVTTGIATATTLTSIPPPPPGPPPSHSRQSSKHSNHSKTPSINVPSVPRVKVPKQYAPPTIVVDTASPDGTRMNISEPIHTYEQDRFQDRPLGGGHVVVSTEGTDPRRDVDPRAQGDVAINTGKSTLYG